MAGISTFFQKALGTVASGAAHLFPSVSEGTAWSAMKATAAKTYEDSGRKLGVSGMKQVFSEFKAMRSRVAAEGAERWAAEVAANPALASVKLNAAGTPKMNFGHWMGGATTDSMIRGMAAGGDRNIMANDRIMAVRLGAMAGVGLPIATSMMFGQDSAPANFTRSLRNAGVSAGVGMGLGAMHPIAGAAWGGISGFNAIRGAGFSPLGLFS